MALDQDLTDLLTAEPELARKLAHLISISGIGLTTTVVVVAETNGFLLVENERQLTSYAGLDVVQRQSKLSNLTTRISRRGNVRLRTALYLPAVSSSTSTSRKGRQRTHMGKAAELTEFSGRPSKEVFPLRRNGFF